MIFFVLFLDYELPICIVSFLSFDDLWLPNGCISELRRCIAFIAFVVLGFSGLRYLGYDPIHGTMTQFMDTSFPVLQLLHKLYSICIVWFAIIRCFGSIELLN
jgi:hypothetical protein